jgi:hypothetical protein
MTDQTNNTETTMKKFAISLIALAAVSTVAFAGENRSYELRESDTYFGKYSEQLVDKATSVNAMTVIKKAGAVSNFDRQSWIAEENNSGRH